MGLDGTVMGFFDRRMKIALVSPYDATIQGGVTKHIAGLASQLRRWGHQVAVLAPCSPRTPGGDSLAAQAGLINLSSHVVRFPYSGSVAHICIDPRAWWRAGWQLRHTRFDVIHVHEPFAPGIPWAVLSQARRAASTILVGTFHAYRERRSRMYSWAGPLWVRGMRLLDGHIAVSSATASFWNQYVPVAFQLIPNGIDPAFFARPAEEPQPNGDEVLFIGRLEPRKGLDVLLRAWAIVEAHDPQVWLTVAGAYTLADCRPYQELAGRLQLRRVRFVGPIPEMRLPAHYRRASVVCTPATGYESFGLVVLEAMAAGRPVVASNIAGYRSVMGDCLEGLLVQPNCPQAFATSILSLLRDPIRREVLGERGRCAAVRYSWETITNQILVYYDELQRQKTR
jgi:phosphatidylinositol alpha-mannosyltransferase